MADWSSEHVLFTSSGSPLIGSLRTLAHRWFECMKGSNGYSKTWSAWYEEYLTEPWLLPFVVRSGLRDPHSQFSTNRGGVELPRLTEHQTLSGFGLVRGKCFALFSLSFDFILLYCFYLFPCFKHRYTYIKEHDKSIGKNVACSSVWNNFFGFILCKWFWNIECYLILKK